MALLYIYFATGHGRTRLGRVSNAIIRAAGRSDLCHVFVGTAERTLALSKSGLAWWPTAEFVARYPNLADSFAIPCARAVICERGSCVRRARESLRLSGVDAPLVFTPGSLHRWLLKRQSLEQHTLRLCREPFP